MTTGQRGSRSLHKRARIVETAMRHFAQKGYQAARVEDMAAEMGIAKGSVFQHFGTKEGLFLATYQTAVARFSKWLDAPEEVRARGFFETMRYWLLHTERLLREDWVPYRIALLGNYGTDLGLRCEINRFLRDQDPYGTVAFVSEGLRRGELRPDIDPEMIVSILDWTMERFQDALLTEELDPGLFRRHGGGPDRTVARIEQFLAVLRSAIGAPPAPPTASRPRRARAGARARARFA